MKKQGIDHAFEHITFVNVCVITQRKKMLFIYKIKWLEWKFQMPIIDIQQVL